MIFGITILIHDNSYYNFPLTIGQCPEKADVLSKTGHQNRG